MDKKEIYYKYAVLPKDDGTFDDYFLVYEKHPQVNEKILKRACIEFSKYVRFCMNAVTKYKSKKSNKYTQIYKDNEVDLNDYEVKVYWRIKEIIYNNTDLSTIEYPNIEGLIKIHSLNENYMEVFNRLLDGETFLEL